MRYPYDVRLARRLMGQGVLTNVAAELTTLRSPERIEKELERLRRMQELGPVPKPGGLLVRWLRGADRPLPGWPPSTSTNAAEGADDDE